MVARKLAPLRAMHVQMANDNCELFEIVRPLVDQTTSKVV